MTVGRAQVLVERDPEGRPISGCPMYGPAIRPCKLTLKVDDGYSDLLRIGGPAVCLDTVDGLTDGTPPGVVELQGPPRRAGPRDGDAMSGPRYRAWQFVHPDFDVPDEEDGLRLTARRAMRDDRGRPGRASVDPAAAVDDARRAGDAARLRLLAANS